MRKNGKKFILPVILFTAFVLWTMAVCFVDVQAIGPQESRVGLAEMNRFVHGLTGVHFALYTITDWLSLIPAAICAGFGVLGLTQWIRRGRLRRVDRSLFILAGFYFAVAAAYVLFEMFEINYRPVLIEGRLEASYPSSTTMLVLCVMLTAAMQLNGRIRNGAFRRWVISVIVAFAAFMVIGRLISGVHWFSDIVGGVLLSAGLLALYASVAQKTDL